LTKQVYDGIGVTRLVSWKYRRLTKTSLFDIALATVLDKGLPL
jgi:hypothetical protein